MPSSRVPCVNPARLLFIFLLLLSASFRVIAAPAPMEESAEKTQMKVVQLWDNKSRIQARLFFRRQYLMPGKKRPHVVPPKERVLRSDEEIVFRLRNYISLTPTKYTSAVQEEWSIKSESKTISGEMLSLGTVELEAHEIIELVRDITALRSHSTSLDAADAVVGFFLGGSPRWTVKFTPHDANCKLWKEMVEAKRDPLSYQGSEWNVDELKKESGNNDNSPTPVPLNHRSLTDSKKESHK